MKNKSISLLIPSRERLEMLFHVIKNVIQKSHNKKNIELILALDADDFSSFGTCPLHEVYLKNNIDYELYKSKNLSSYIENVKYFLKHNKFSKYVRIIEFSSHKVTNNQRYNFLLPYASGEYIFILGDDCEIVTQNWDKIFLDSVNEIRHTFPKDNVCYFRIDDGAHKYEQRVCAFPVVTKNIQKKLNLIFPEELHSWGCDFLLYEIFVSENLKEKRFFDFWNKIQVIHYSHFSQFDEFKRPIDKTQQKTRDDAGDTAIKPSIIQKYVNILNS